MILLCLLVTGAFAWLLTELLREDEPEYQGKPLSYYLGEQSLEAPKRGTIR